MTEHTAPTMPQPTAEHSSLKQYVGKWNVDCNCYMEPGTPPMKMSATETIEMVGEFWTASRYEANFMGAPFVGRTTMGYEPHKGRYVMTWIDCMSPVLFHMTGTRQGDTITMTGKALSCHTNTELVHRTTWKTVHANEHHFEMFVTMPDGKEMKMMSSVYKRA